MRCVSVLCKKCILAIAVVVILLSLRMSDTPFEKVSLSKSMFYGQYFGELLIPAENLAICLFDSEDIDQSQNIVDAHGAGWIHRYRNFWLLGDHAGQGFRVIKKLHDGDLAYIRDCCGPVSVYRYCGKSVGFCVDDTHGVAEGYDIPGVSIVAEDGVPIVSGDSDPGYPLMLYTCNNSDGSEMTITYWEVVIG